MITLRMTRLRQEPRDLFMGPVRTEDIIRLSRVAEWNEETEEGYQRAPEISRIRKLAAFLKSESVPMLPSSVLLSHRGKPLTKRELAQDVYEIEVPDDEVLWIVDGQHRIGGLRMAIERHGLDRFRDFQLPVVLMEFDDETEEAHQFQLINENMKKVNTMLARRLLQMRLERGGADVKRALRESRRLWEADSVEVIRSMTSDSSSMWHGRIQAPNQKKLPEHIIRELSFSTSLRQILTDDLARDLTIDKITQFLKNYWNAWRVLIPEAFEEPEQFVIQKSSGVFIQHQVAKYVLRLLSSRNNHAPTVNDIVTVLTDAGEASTAEYWRVGNTEGAALAGSMGGFKMVADIIIETLQHNGQSI